MAKSLKKALQKLNSYASAHGGFKGGSEIGEPKDAPDNLHASFIVGPNYRIEALTLNTIIEVREVTIRIYYDALAEPREDAEFILDEFVGLIIEDWLADIDLSDAGVREIRVAEIVCRFGYQTVGGKMFRIVDIVVPLVVDDSATLEGR